MRLHHIPRSLLAALLLCATAAYARGPEPSARIPLAPLGYLAATPRATLSGDATATVHFVDATHLLLTFSTRGLLTRIPEDPPTDEDRLIDALLLELPSGKLLARTTWRTHDHRPYLWPLTNGYFLLRIRNRITLIAPLQSLHAHLDPFVEKPFLNSQRRIASVNLSPGAQVLAVQSLPIHPPALTGSVGDPSFNTPDDVQVNFYRLHPSPTGEPTAIAAGSLRADGFLNLPLTAEGFLDLARESPHTIDFDFYTYAGTKYELSPFETSCLPQASFLSPTEFLAFGCRGASERPSLSAFNLKGEQLWIADLAAGLRQPFIASIPAAGRFALSRLLFTGIPADPANILPEEIASQEVTVLQTWSGQTLLKLSATPIQREGQNFALAPDGLTFAILREGNIEIYPLPPLTGKDREEIALTQKTQPPPSEANIRLTLRNAPPPPPPPTGVVTLDPDTIVSPNPPEPSVASPEQAPPRPRPTLYNPGEAPQK